MIPTQVTVFGASGFVGRNVVRRLAEAGIRVIAAQRNAAAAGFLRTLGEVGQVTPVSCDVTRADQVAAALAGSDAAVSLVGILFETRTRTFAALHAAAPETIARAAKTAGIGKLVHVSAIGADVAAASRYHQTKAMGEAACRGLLPQTVILRPSVIFGPDDDFFNRFAALARVAPALPLFGGGDTRFQPVYVGDVAEALFAGLSRDELAGRSFELGGPDRLSFRQTLELVLAESSRRRLLLPLPMALADIIGLAGDALAWCGITPPLTRDQARLLRTDNVVPEGADGLEALGITPTPAAAILPGYMGRHRPGGS